MNPFTSIFIPVNRKKMILMTIVYGVLGLLACLFTYYLGAYQDLVSHTVFKVASVIVFAFFAVVAGTFAKNIKNQDAGLEISAKGLDDQTTSISAGMIAWKEILSISSVKTISSRYLLIHVKQPQEIIKKAKNSAVKRLLQQNLSIYKTPIVVNAGSLTESLTKIEEDVNRFYERFAPK